MQVEKLERRRVQGVQIQHTDIGAATEEIQVEHIHDIGAATEEDPVQHIHDIGAAVKIAMVIFSIGFMISEPNLDGFNLQEALEFLSNRTIESVPIHIAGFVTSFLANIPLLAAIIYCWMHQDRHGHGHEGESHHHHHDRWQELLEMVTIGTPFALMGVAAYLDTLSELVNIDDLSLVWRIVAYSGSAVSGLLTGFGAYKLHGFHLHAAMEEHGGEIRGFFIGLYTTFFRNVWLTHVDQPSVAGKLIAIFNEFWKKYGIVGMHVFLGSYAANSFLKATGLDQASPTFSLILKILLPLFVALFEGNTEARSLDSYKSNTEQSVSYSICSKLIVTLSGILHTLPALTDLARLMGGSSSGPLYNSLFYTAATAILAYPSVYGFVATTIKGYDDAVTGVIEKLTNSMTCCNQSREQAEDQEPEDNQGTCLELMRKIGFLKEPSPESRPLSDLGGAYVPGIAGVWERNR